MKTIIELLNLETFKTETLIIDGWVSVIVGGNEARIIHHHEDSKVDVIDLTNKQIVVRNWGY